MSLSNLFKCTIEGDSSWFHLMVGTPNQLVSLKVRVGRPNGAREWYCDGTTGRVRPVYRCAWPLIVGRESYKKHESRDPPGAHAKQGKEEVHLVGNRIALTGPQGRAPCSGSSSRLSLFVVLLVR